MDTLIAVIRVNPSQKKYNRLETISQKTLDFDRVYSLVLSNVQNFGGHIYGREGDDIYVEMPVKNAERLKNILEIAIHDLHIPVGIGVGEQLPQAIKAAEYTANNGLNQIKVYHPSIEEQQEDNVGDAVPVAIGEGDNISKCEQYSLLKNEQKQKLQQAVQIISQNKQLLTQLQQSSPETYKSIVGALTAAAQIMEGKAEQEDIQNKQTDKVNQSMEKHHNRAQMKQIEAIRRKIADMDSDRLDQRREEQAKFHKSKRAKEKAAHVKAARYALKTGHHSPTFLAKLVTKLGDK